MRISSPAFRDGGPIPLRHTGLGRNVSPPLVFADVPAAARSLVLVVEDVDAAPTPWTHWLVFDIPVTSDGAPDSGAPQGGVEGSANGGGPGYEGPNQIYFSGRHRYRFTLLALDTVLDLPATADKARVLAAAEGHVVRRAELTGTAEGVAVAAAETAG